MASGGAACPGSLDLDVAVSFRASESFGRDKHGRGAYLYGPARSGDPGTRPRSAARAQWRRRAFTGRGAGSTRATGVCVPTGPLNERAVHEPCTKGQQHSSAGFLPQTCARDDVSSTRTCTRMHAHTHTHIHTHTHSLTTTW